MGIIIMSNSLGEVIAYEDEVIKRTLKNIEEKEKKLIKEYKNINESKLNNFSHFIPYINENLEQRRKFLLYKKMSKENQYIALLKLLEYLNSIESINKKLETEKILSKISLIEKELTPYKEILM